MENPAVPQIPQIPPPIAPPEQPHEQPHEHQQQPKKRRVSAIVIVALLLVGLVAGGFIGYALSYSAFNSKLTSIENQLASLTSGDTYNTYPNATYIIGYNSSLSTLYADVKSSVVLIQDLVLTQVFFIQGYSQQQGSGFITEANNQLVIVTNNHVVLNAINITVTFANGATYQAKEIGSDSQADLAVLTINPMPSGLTPLTLVSSNDLQVGQPVVAVGSPYGL